MEVQSIQKRLKVIGEMKIFINKTEIFVVYQHWSNPGLDGEGDSEEVSSILLNTSDGVLRFLSVKINICYVKFR